MQKFPVIYCAILLCLVACQQEPNEVLSQNDNPSDSLVILGFYPDTAHVGDSVLVWGRKFDPSVNGDLVNINSIRQQVLWVRDTLLLFRIVNGTTTGKIQVSARGQQASSSKDLVIDSIRILPFLIVSFSPDSSRVGDTVMIKGTGFSYLSADHIVDINGVQQQVIASTDTTILIRIAPGTTTGKISVTLKGRTVISPKNLVIVTNVPPQLTLLSFSPDSARIGDTVIITGTGFGSVAYAATVKINGNDAEIISLSPDRIVIKIAAGTTTGKIGITVNGQNVSSASNLFIIQVGGPWIQKKDLPAQWSSYASVLGISAGNRGFYFNGQLWEYLPQQDTWVKKADKPADREGFYSFSFLINNRVYIGYGGTTSFDSVKLWAYHLSTDTWVKKKNLPIPPRIAPFGFAANNTGYVGGGQVSFTGDMNAHDFWKYDEQNDTWTRLADFPGSWTIGISGFSVGAEAYVYDAGLGFPQAPTIAHSSGKLWKYEAVANTWVEKATNPGGAGAMSATVFVINDKAYVSVAVMKNPPEPKQDFWMYDPTLNTWKQKTDVGGGLRWFGSGFSIANKGYVGLGTGNTVFQQRKDFWEYTPE